MDLTKSQQYDIFHCPSSQTETSKPRLFVLREDIKRWTSTFTLSGITLWSQFLCFTILSPFAILSNDSPAVWKLTSVNPTLFCEIQKPQYHKEEVNLLEALTWVEDNIHSPTLQVIYYYQIANSWPAPCRPKPCLYFSYLIKLTGTAQPTTKTILWFKLRTWDFKITPAPSLG